MSFCLRMNAWPLEREGALVTRRRPFAGLLHYKRTKAHLGSRRHLSKIIRWESRGPPRLGLSWPWLWTQVPGSHLRQLPFSLWHQSYHLLHTSSINSHTQKIKKHLPLTMTARKPCCHLPPHPLPRPSLHPTYESSLKSFPQGLQPVSLVQTLNTFYETLQTCKRGSQQPLFSPSYPGNHLWCYYPGLCLHQIITFVSFAHLHRPLPSNLTPVPTIVYCTLHFPPPYWKWPTALSRADMTLYRHSKRQCLRMRNVLQRMKFPKWCQAGLRKYK